MENFIKNNWSYIIPIVSGLFVFYKFILQRLDTAIDKKKKKIELIEKIDKKFTKDIAEFLCAEKFNIYFRVNFSTEKMKACMNSYDNKTAIKIVERYYNLIEVKENKLIPQKILNLESKKWTCFSYGLTVLLVVTSLIGLFLPLSMYGNKDDVSILTVVLFRYGVFFPFFVFSLRELVNLIEARKFFKIYLKRNKIAAGK